MTDFVLTSEQNHKVPLIDWISDIFSEVAWIIEILRQIHDAVTQRSKSFLADSCLANSGPMQQLSCLVVCKGSWVHGLMLSM